MSGYKEFFAFFGYKETTELLGSNYPYTPIYTSEHLIVFASIKRTRTERHDTYFCFISIDILNITIAFMLLLLHI